MKFCSQCGKQIDENAVFCPFCGSSDNFSKAPQRGNADEVNAGLCVLSALIPIVGIIYWIANHKESPKKANACGIASLVAWAVYFLFLL